MMKTSPAAAEAAAIIIFFLHITLSVGSGSVTVGDIISRQLTLSQFRGQVLPCCSKYYEHFRKVKNGACQNIRPLVIIRPVDTHDVSAGKADRYICKVRTYVFLWVSKRFELAVNLVAKGSCAVIQVVFIVCIFYSLVNPNKHTVYVCTL